MGIGIGMKWRMGIDQWWGQEEGWMRWMREGLWRVLCLGLSWRAAAAAMGAAEEDWD